MFYMVSPRNGKLSNDRNIKMNFQKFENDVCFVASILTHSYSPGHVSKLQIIMTYFNKLVGIAIFSNKIQHFIVQMVLGELFLKTFVQRYSHKNEVVYQGSGDLQGALYEISNYGPKNVHYTFKLFLYGFQWHSWVYRLRYDSSFPTHLQNTSNAFDFLSISLTHFDVQTTGGVNSLISRNKLNILITTTT